MGISGFATFLYEYFSNCWTAVNPATETSPHQFDYVYLDANCLLYGPKTSSRSKAAFLSSLIADVDRYLRWTGPPQVVFIALDGPGASIGSLACSS